MPYISRLTELVEIASAEQATSWAQRILGAKNSLITADARRVEDAFRARMATFGSAADINDVPSSPIYAIGGDFGRDG